LGQSQAKAAHGEAANFQERPAREAIAIAVPRAEEGKHWRVSVGSGLQEGFERRARFVVGVNVAGERVRKLV
jgi:hypothetical protein